MKTADCLKLSGLPEKLKAKNTVWKKRSITIRNSKNVLQTNQDLVLVIPDNVTTIMPFEAYFYSSFQSNKIARKINVVVGKNSRVSLICRADNYRNKKNNAIVGNLKVVLQEKAELNMANIQKNGTNLKILNNAKIIMGRNSKMTWTVVNEGGNNSGICEIILAGDGASAASNICFFAKNQENSEITLTTRNEAKYTKGSVLVKSVLQNNAKIKINGLVDIEPQAKESKSRFSAKTLLVGKGASFSVTPVIKAKTKNTEAGHSVTASPVDQDSIFYLQSRGISKRMAEDLLVKGFLKEALERNPDKIMREKILNIQ